MEIVLIHDESFSKCAFLFLRITSILNKGVGRQHQSISIITYQTYAPFCERLDVWRA